MTGQAWEWVDHLRAGGTTTWSDWRARPVVSDGPGGRLLPGAQQLELLRRLNGRERPGPGLVDRVLWASAPGRGRSDLELEGAVEPLAFGPAPVDPGGLPVVALLRVAVGLVAEDVVAAGDAAQPAPPARRSWWRPRQRVVGDPWLVGRSRTGRASRVVVVGTDLPSMLAHAWLARACSDLAPTWPAFLRRVRRRGHMPRGVDLAAVARRHAANAGASRVRVVLDPARGTSGSPDLAWEAGELARRVGGALTHMVTEPQRVRLMASVVRPELERRAPGRLPVVPPRHRDWVDEQAERIRGDLRSGGYPVEGDPDALLPSWGDDSSRPDPEAEMSRVLDLAIDLLLSPGAGAAGRRHP